MAWLAEIDFRFISANYRPDCDLLGLVALKMIHGLFYVPNLATEALLNKSLPA